MIANGLLPYLQAAILLHIVPDDSRDLDHVVAFTAQSIDTAIRADTGFQVESEDIVSALLALAAAGLVTRHQDPYADDFFEITKQNFDAILAEGSHDGSIVQRSQRLGKVWLLSAFGNAALRAATGGPSKNNNASEVVTVHETLSPEDRVDASVVPASDRIVSLKHNSDPYRQAIESLDAIVREIRADNRTGGFSTEEKEAAIADLTAGRQLLGATKVRARSVYELIHVPLTWVVKVYAQGTIQELAKALFSHLRILFGF